MEPALSSISMEAALASPGLRAPSTSRPFLMKSFSSPRFLRDTKVFSPAGAGPDVAHVDPQGEGLAARRQAVAVAALAVVHLPGDGEGRLGPLDHVHRGGHVGRRLAALVVEVDASPRRGGSPPSAAAAPAPTSSGARRGGRGRRRTRAGRAVMFLSAVVQARRRRKGASPRFSTVTVQGTVSPARAGRPGGGRHGHHRARRAGAGRAAGPVDAELGEAGLEPLLLLQRAARPPPPAAASSSFWRVGYGARRSSSRANRIW